ncbi:MAG: tetratricopeptide repeat protein [Planctomycetaceae bacterium]|jgi:Tfp pilus assembly protein PilF|nr:tetratricopeptide repeat protein [Planctomycetaceae bacterium]
MSKIKQQILKILTKPAQAAGISIRSNSMQIKRIFVNLPFTVFGVGIFMLAMIILDNGVVVLAQENPIRVSGEPTGTPPVNAVPATPANTEGAITDPVVKAELEKAVATFKESKFAETLEILKALFQSHPEIAPPRIVMARMFAQAKLGDAVRANLELGTEETPADPEAYLLLGEIALRQRYLTSAELLLKHASETLKVYSASPVRKKNLTSSLLRVFTDLYETRQRWVQMESCINEQVQFDGQNATLLRRKGIAVFRQNRDDEAKRLLAQADQLDQTNTEPTQKGLPANAIMSQLYLSRGDKDNARMALEAALAAYPKSKEILALSVQMRISDDKLEAARPLAQQLLDEDPTSAAAKRLRATVALYLQDYGLAERLFQELLLESPTDSQAQNGLALALCEQNSPDKQKRAVEYAADNVRKYQGNSEFWGTLGWVQLKANLIDDAAKSLRQSVATGAINAATAYYLAQLSIKSNKNDEAKQLLELALKGNNQFAKRREAAQILNRLQNTSTPQIRIE